MKQQVAFWKQPSFLKDGIPPRAGVTLRIAIKTAVAALLTDLIARWFSMQAGYLAVVTTLIVMQANLGSSFMASGQRLVGTAVGAVVAAVVFSLLGSGPIALGTGIALTVIVCALLRVYDSFRIATVTFALVVLVGHTNVWQSSLERFYEVGIGILVALGVTVGLWPPRTRQDLRNALADILEQDAELYRLTVSSHLGREIPGSLEHRQAIRSSLAQVTTLAGDISREPPSAEDPQLATVRTAVERLQEDLFAMEHRAVPEDARHILCRLEAVLETLCSESTAAFGQCAMALRSRKPVTIPASLRAALTALETQVGELRRNQVFQPLSFDQLLHLTTFLDSLREVVSELEALAEEMTKLAEI